MKKTCAFLIASAFALQAAAFSRDEHEALTKLAGKWYNECVSRGDSIVSAPLFDSTVLEMAQANSFEDLNVAKKWTVASHFYNPIKKFDWGKVGGIGRGDADDAVERALGKYEAHSGSVAKRIGQVLHYVQDMSSPLHVIGVNHALGDGFENNEEVAAFASAKASTVSCARVRSKAREPLTILRMNATMTLKLSDQAYKYRLNGDTRTHEAKWSETFYVNGGLSSSKLSALLKKFDPIGRMFDLGRGDYPAGAENKLPRGTYGAFANPQGLSKKDNFGKTEFTITAAGVTRTIRIERDEYAQYKKKLMLEAVQASMETIAWGMTNQNADELTH